MAKKSKPAPDFWSGVKLPGGADPAYDAATKKRAKETLKSQQDAAARAAARAAKPPPRPRPQDTGSTGARGRKQTLGRVLKSM